MTESGGLFAGRKTLCPCGSGQAYASCCGPCHRGDRLPETAEQLMRSRYAAYHLRLADYLYRTTHPDQRTADLLAEIAAWAQQVDFFRLEIVRVRQGQAGDKVGKVEFVAHYRQQQQVGKLQERSRFRRYKGAWVYFDGETV